MLDSIMLIELCAEIHILRRRRLAVVRQAAAAAAAAAVIVAAASFTRLWMGSLRSSELRRSLLFNDDNFVQF